MTFLLLGRLHEECTSHSVLRLKWCINPFTDLFMGETVFVLCARFCVAAERENVILCRGKTHDGLLKESQRPFPLLFAACTCSHRHCRSVPKDPVHPTGTGGGRAGRRRRWCCTVDPTSADRFKSSRLVFQRAAHHLETERATLTLPGMFF